jgi:hypothetical protein
MEVLDVAFVCAWDSINPYPASVDLLKVYIDSIRADYLANPDDFGFDPALAIEEHNSEYLPLEIFPNPTNKTLNIQIPKQIQSAKLEIYDLSGRIIQTETLSNESIYQLDVEGLRSGFYTLRLISEEGIYVGKFVKE